MKLSTLGLQYIQWKSWYYEILKLNTIIIYRITYYVYPFGIMYLKIFMDLHVPVT